MNEQINYCGIDVSNETLDLYFVNKEGTHQHLQISNTITGFRNMLKETGRKVHFVMEATGVYHLNLIFFLEQKKNALQRCKCIKNQALHSDAFRAQ